MQTESARRTRCCFCRLYVVQQSTVQHCGPLEEEILALRRALHRTGRILVVRVRGDQFMSRRLEGPYGACRLEGGGREP